jgi:hypothetical protein
MHVSEIFAVEYSPRQTQWRIITLDQVLKGNYNDYLNALQGIPTRPTFDAQQPDWILLGIGSSKEEAEALVDKLEGIKDAFVQELRAVRGSYAAQG